MGGHQYFHLNERDFDDEDKRFFRQQEWLREHKKWSKQHNEARDRHEKLMHKLVCDIRIFFCYKRDEQTKTQFMSYDILCPCGSTIQRKNYKIHLKTKKHQKLIKENKYCVMIDNKPLTVPMNLLLNLID
tara:strand:- start:270 stop:659 length:390 start_codon:yes stop_codon:yes gene_type:complete